MSQAPFTKTELVSFAQQIIAEKIDRVKNILAEISDSIVNESKSSAGDKHETGIAMLHLEVEKNNQVLNGLMAEENALLSLPTDRISDVVVKGSLVLAAGNYFFLGVGLGIKMVNGKNVIMVSESSPIGRELLRKKNGDYFIFNHNRLIIEEIF